MSDLFGYEKRLPLRKQKKCWRPRVPSPGKYIPLNDAEYTRVYSRNNPYGTLAFSFVKYEPTRQEARNLIPVDVNTEGLEIYQNEEENDGSESV